MAASLPSLWQNSSDMERESTAPRPRAPWVAERLAWAIGIVCLVVYAAFRIAGAVGTRHELKRFEGLRTSREREPIRFEQKAPDQSLWSPERIRAWQASLQQQPALPLAVLRIPKIRLEVPVLDGTDDWTLNRAVGRIAGTARAGGSGNLGIAGHRDGFFRSLKDLVAGDTLELETYGGKDTYVVEKVWIVGPEDVSVLESTPVPSVTLVTCYPFYFVGSAPERYIVRAVRHDGTAGHS
jgi:sortase A